MSENTNKTEPGNDGDSPANHRSKSRSGISQPFVLSAIAILLAALALTITLTGRQAPSIDSVQAITSKLEQIEARIDDIESGQTSDKQNLVNMRLKRIQLRLEQLSRLADDATRSKIEQAYHLLEPLSEPATEVRVEVDTQSTLAPENQAATEGASTEQMEQSSSGITVETPATTPETQNGAATDNELPAIAGGAVETQPDTAVVPETGNDTVTDAVQDSNPGSPPDQQEAAPSEHAPAMHL